MKYLILIIAAIVLLPILAGQVNFPDNIQAEELGKFLGAILKFWKELFDSAIHITRA